jgi:hypothetical protein
VETSEDKFRIWYERVVAAVLISLAAVIVAITVGVSPRRLWPVAGYLAVAAGANGYNSVTRRARTRLSHRQRQAPAPVGVRLRKPMWLRLESTMIGLGFVGLVGAIISAIGFPQVSLGILLVLGGLAAFWSQNFRDPDLTIEAMGCGFISGRRISWSRGRPSAPSGQLDRIISR